MNSYATAQLSAPVRYGISAIIVGLGIAAMVVFYKMRKPPAEKPFENRIPAVNYYVAEEFSEKLGIEVSGIVVPHREIRMAALVGGTITEKHCEAGTFVRKGDILYRIDPKDFELQIKQIKREVSQATKSIEESQAEESSATEREKLARKDFELSQADFDRKKKLGGVLSQSEFTVAQKNLNAAKQALEQAQSNLKLATMRVARLKEAKALSETMLEKAELDLERTTIAAPSDGIVVRDLVEKGDFVQRGTQLLMFEDTSRSEVTCNLRPDQIQWLWENSSDPSNRPTENPYQLPPTSVKVKSDFGGEENEWLGRLESYDGFGLDERTKMVPVRILIENPVAQADSGGNRALIRNMYVKVHIEIDTQMMTNAGHQFVKIPGISVRPGDYIWVLRDSVANPADDDNQPDPTEDTDTESESSGISSDSAETAVLDRVKIRPVDRKPGAVGDQFESYVIVRVGPKSLRPNDRVVLTPMTQPEIGATVKVNAPGGTQSPDSETPDSDTPDSDTPDPDGPEETSAAGTTSSEDTTSSAAGAGGEPTG